MPELSLRVLGSMQILRDGEPVAGLESDKVRALLIYLAVEAAREHARGTVAALLWPDQPAPSAHHNLRQALTNLRRCLGDRGTTQPFLRITRATIQLNPDSDYVLDVADFTAQLDACDAHAHRRSDSCQSCAHRRMQAIERYEGDFLASFAPRESLPFEEWAGLWRERPSTQWTLKQK